MDRFRGLAWMDTAAHCPGCRPRGVPWSLGDAACGEQRGGMAGLLPRTVHAGSFALRALMSVLQLGIPREILGEGVSRILISSGVTSQSHGLC